jgi:uncharacterized protein (DUF4415 family)
MNMKRRPLTDKDGEVRELTAEDFKGMRPLREVHPELIEAMQAMRDRVSKDRRPSEHPGSGRSKAEQPKVRIGFRLAADVVKGVKATGKGYNARVEMILRDALAKGLLAAREPKR